MVWPFNSAAAVWQIWIEVVDPAAAVATAAFSTPAFVDCTLFVASLSNSNNVLLT